MRCDGCVWLATPRNLQTKPRPKVKTKNTREEIKENDISRH